ncbi:hypothetical protein J2810_002778 [Chryseobacterium rhizosphaerae]|uniref:JAB-like toxin 1 domain-containing protein n=1 Tax=Chryseobacterium rhizosphaerae TaxID=395937 RepID=UPI0028658CC1|nr:JAB-like toxin 1 domain-containing protein [Chryseobacterium rhizosphaerae]MDR6546672.1 hypothetical protein [Chryseobacterium rhizosphaerae]MDR6546718.1 hypothetical protein [Chryseobacterium rhizosphaerae]
MKKILLIVFAIVTGFTQAQIKKKTPTKLKAEKKWVNPVKLTKEEKSRPYMDEVLKTKDSLTPQEAERRRKNIAVGNPFAKYGVYPKIATLSRGKYLEFHDTDSIVIIGSVKYNTKRQNIIEVREVDLSDPDAQPIGDTHGRWMSPDPLSEEFPDWSPYNYAMNNPINNIDPTGLAPESAKDDYKLLKNGQIELIKKTDDKSDTLFATDNKGNVDKSKSVTVQKPTAESGSIISSLATDYGLAENRYPDGINFGRTTNANDAANVFMFSAKNSNVEWGLEAFKVGNGISYTVFTGHDDDSTPPNFFNQSPSKSLFNIHSHKGVDGPSPINGQTNGDYGISRGGDNYYNRRTGRTDYPSHYLYYAPNKGKSSLWMYHWRNTDTYKKNLGTSTINLKNLGK